MKAHSHVLKRWAREAWVVEGLSYRRVAICCGVPVGTVKAWASRGGWARAVVDATGAAEGKPCRMQPAAERHSHRGLRKADLPGRPGRVAERLRWAMFCIGQWPPRGWKVPEGLQGMKLRLLLEERHAMFYANVGKGRKARDALFAVAEGALPFPFAVVGDGLQKPEGRA